MNWIEVVLPWAIAALSAIYVYSAARNVVLRRRAMPSLFLGLAGFLYLAANGLIGGWGASLGTGYVETVKKSSKPIEVLESAFANLEPSERASRSTQIAQRNFSASGVLTEHWLPDGTKTLYVPTQADLAEYRNHLRQIAEVEAKLEASRATGVAFAIFALFALVAGAVNGWSNGRRDDA